MKMNMKKIAPHALATLVSLGLFSSLTPMVSAQAGNVDPIQLSNLNLKDMISLVVNYILWAAGVVALVYLIWGGLMYITAGGDSAKADKGRTAITNAIIGIILVAASLTIYRFVITAGQGKSVNSNNY